uniref:Transposase n=1 Tax=Heterorhabditis bacteriophora TaxID=37862 RepID=A0A1I7XIA8_HETBA
MNIVGTRRNMVKYMAHKNWWRMTYTAKQMGLYIFRKQDDVIQDAICLVRWLFIRIEAIYRTITTLTLLASGGQNNDPSPLL